MRLRNIGKPTKKFAVWKKILLAIFVLILASASTAIFIYSIYLHSTGEIMPGLYAVRNYRNGNPLVNFFIMQADEKYIAFDTGSDSTQTQNALQQLGISVSE